MIGAPQPLVLAKPAAIDTAQAARYFGARGEPDDRTMTLLETCAMPLLAAATPRAVWLEADTAALAEAGILRDARVDVYRTDLQGTITIGSDGQNYTVGTEHFAADSALNPTDPAASSTAQQAYIGNVNSKKFHLPTCPNLPAEKNQILFSSYQEAVEAGYTPCSSCIK